MPSKVRLQRIGERIREEISEMLIRDIQDPRLTGIYITDVTVDRELAFAEVYVSAVEGISRSKDILEGLEHARGFLRSALAQRLDLRSFPRLRFHWDVTPERAEHIEKILATLRVEPETPEEENADE